MGSALSNELPSSPVSLHHFRIGQTIGRGAFGRVRIVEGRKSQKSFALKYIDKEQLIHQKAQCGVLRERAILEQVEHPFVVNLRFAFQDDENLFMVLDLMLGGDLRFRMTSQGRLPVREVLFYAAEIALALRYLHQKNVLHRDVKPDNLLLDGLGHVHLTDFNCACVISGSAKVVSSETGTHGYMAPEVYQAKGYLHPVDWWGLGISLYELLFGYRPFDAEEIDDLINQVCTADPKFEPCHDNDHATRRSASNGSDDIPIEVVALLRGFLEKDPELRLGSKERPIWNYPAFEGCQWAALEAKMVDPPFKPNPSSSNFDPRYELEDMFLIEKPLQAKGRSSRPTSANHLHSPYYREFVRLEREFKNFDHELFDRYAGIIDPGTLSVGEPPAWVKCVDGDPLKGERFRTRPRQRLESCTSSVWPPDYRAPSSALNNAHEAKDVPFGHGRAKTAPVDPRNMYKEHYDDEVDELAAAKRLAGGMSTIAPEDD